MPAISSFNIEAPLYDVVISEEQALKKLLALKVSKSLEPDLLHPRLLKEVAHEIATPLTLIYQKSFDAGILPQNWKMDVIPIFKKGSCKAPGNYKPVSLTSVVVKLFELVIRDLIMEHSLHNHLLSNQQHGFITKRSCMTQLLSVMDNWTNALEDGYSVDVYSTLTIGRPLILYHMGG